MSNSNWLRGGRCRAHTHTHAHTIRRNSRRRFRGMWQAHPGRDCVIIYYPAMLCAQRLQHLTAWRRQDERQPTAGNVPGATLDRRAVAPLQMIPDRIPPRQRVELITSAVRPAITTSASMSQRRLCDTTPSSTLRYECTVTIVSAPCSASLNSRPRSEMNERARRRQAWRHVRIVPAAFTILPEQVPVRPTETSRNGRNSESIPSSVRQETPLRRGRKLGVPTR